MIPMVMALCFLSSLPPDAAEVLGFDPLRPPSFRTLYERREPPSKEAGWTVKRIEIAGVGGDRFLFGVHFAEEFPADNSILILYVDTDADPRTGREGHGCELMLTVHDRSPSTTAFAADGRRIRAPRPRSMVGESSVWISYDTNFLQKEGKSHFRLAVLSEKSRPHVGVDHVSYRTYSGPPVSPEPKVELPGDYTRSRGFGRVFDLRSLERILSVEGVIRIPASRAELRGFRPDRSEYRRVNALCSGTGHRLTFLSPVAGAFHVGAVVYDDRGKDVLRVESEGGAIGYIVGAWDDRSQHLFFGRDIVNLTVDQTVTLTSFGDGRHRIEELILLPERPEENEFEWEFRSVTTFEDTVSFITNWPARCELERSDGMRVSENLRGENHRVRIPDARPGGRTRFRLRSRTPEGEDVVSEWLEHHWSVPAPSPQTRSGRVKLTVEAPPETPAGGWPVTSGVPFPHGELANPDRVRLLANGEEKILQVAVLGRWPDRSVRWLLCDFRHEGTTSHYTLEYGPRVERRDSEVAERRGANVPELGSLELERGDGKTFNGKFRWIQEESGPERQCFHSEGNFTAKGGETFFRHESRVHLFPGLGYARVLLSVGADGTCPEFSELRSLTWRLPVGDPTLQAGDGNSLRVEQLQDDLYRTSRGATGRRWNGAVGPVNVRDFWQNYPKAVRTRATSTEVEILPRLEPDQYTWARGTMDEHRLFFWFREGNYRWRQGMSKTHEIWVGLDGSPPPLDRVLRAVCEPEWYVRSAVFGPLPPVDSGTEVLRSYDRAVDKAFSTYLANREKNREYGFLNFGDWWGERVINWGNVEYDTQHALFLQFARTGDPRFFQAAEEAEIHNRDVDTKLWHGDPSRIGLVSAHSIGHVGGYYSKSPHEGRGSPAAYLSVSHSWCEGHLDHYFFTGDARSLEAARKIADHYDTYGLDGYDFTNTRVPGWHLILTLAVHRATGDPFYLNAARIIVERVLERQTLEPLHGRPPGGWVRMMVPGHCHCDPFHYGNAGFMVAVLLTGLRWYHEETGDDRVAAAIVSGARFIVDDMWVPERKGFRYTSCPKSSAGVWSNLLLADGLTYAQELSRDERIAGILRIAIPAGVEGISGFGKGFGQVTRVAPHALARFSGEK